MRPLAFVMLGALLLGAPVADAATVKVRNFDAAGSDDDNILDERHMEVTVEAEPGEVNTLTTTVAGRDRDRTRVTLHDATAPLASGPGCDLVDEHTVECREPASRPRTLELIAVNLQISLGDMNDRLEVDADPAELPRLTKAPYLWLDTGAGQDVATALELYGGSIDGGPGDDVLTAGSRARSTIISEVFIYGGPGDDALTGWKGPEGLDGGPGNDTLAGGAWKDELIGGLGDDLLRGGDGRDTLYGGYEFSSADSGTDSFGGGRGNDTLIDSDPAADPETFDGGAGFDRVDAYRVGGPVTVDLRRTDGQGRSGENDSFIGIEGVFGSPADDVLIGTDGRDYLSGGTGGDDLIDARAGDDEVWIAQGAADGGPGDDHIVFPAWNRRAWATPSLSCGPGSDRVARDREYLRARPDGKPPGPLVKRNCEQLVFPPYDASRLVVHPAPVRVSRAGKLTFRLARALEPPHTFTATRAPAPFDALDSAPVDRPSVSVRVPPGLARRWRTERVTLRATITRDGASRRNPAAWRFEVGPR